MKIRFETATKVARLTEIMNWTGKVPDHAISIMMSCVTQQRPVLLLDGSGTTQERAIAILLPGHDQKWLALYLYTTSPLHPDGKIDGANFCINPDNVPTSLTGDSIAGVMEFAPAVIQCLDQWRQ